MGARLVVGIYQEGNGSNINHYKNVFIKELLAWQEDYSRINNFVAVADFEAQLDSDGPMLVFVKDILLRINNFEFCSMHRSLYYLLPKAKNII